MHFSRQFESLGAQQSQQEKSALQSPFDAQLNPSAGQDICAMSSQFVAHVEQPPAPVETATLEVALEPIGPPVTALVQPVVTPVVHDPVLHEPLDGAPP